MTRKAILTLYWDEDEGQGHINFAGMNKLYGIERADFLNDVIGMLTDYRERIGQSYFDDYLSRPAVTEKDMEARHVTARARATDNMRELIAATSGLTRDELDQKLEQREDRRG
jgi:hypothetical protein